MDKLLEFKEKIKIIFNPEIQEEKIRNLNTEIENLNNKLATLENDLKSLKIASILNNYYRIQNNYNKIIELLKKKVKANRKIDVIFFVIFDSVFPCKSIFEKMLKNKNFNPRIVVIPDISRGEEHMLLNFNQTFNSLSKKYTNVQKGYNEKTKIYIDFSRSTDIVFFASPYTGMTHNYFELNNFIDKDILSCYVTYTYFVQKQYTEFLLNLDAYNMFWKIFIESPKILEEFIKYQPIKALNAYVTGYPKMDNLEHEQIYKKSKKTIILAPHHTIVKNPLINLSNFYKYSHLFLKLPKIYPNIHFVFRPHPLLITTLKKKDCWGKIKTEKYLEKISSFPNVTYSDGGDYFKIFANSDGIIHDCSSFLIEYLFTEKPMLYLLKDKEQIRKNYIPLAQDAFKYIYKALNEKDILNYIDNVIVNNNDPLKEKRINFVNHKLKLNYPNVSDKIIDYLERELLPTPHVIDK